MTNILVQILIDIFVGYNIENQICWKVLNDSIIFSTAHIKYTHMIASQMASECDKCGERTGRKVERKHICSRCIVLRLIWRKRKKNCWQKYVTDTLNLNRAGNKCTSYTYDFSFSLFHVSLFVVESVANIGRVFSLRLAFFYLLLCRSVVSIPLLPSLPPCFVFFLLPPLFFRVVHLFVFFSMMSLQFSSTRIWNGSTLNTSSVVCYIEAHYHMIC